MLTITPKRGDTSAYKCEVVNATLRGNNMARWIQLNVQCKYRVRYDAQCMGSGSTSSVSTGSGTMSSVSTGSGTMSSVSTGSGTMPSVWDLAQRPVTVQCW